MSQFTHALHWPTFYARSSAHIQGGSKSKLLILSEYVNKTGKTGGTWTNTNSYRENEALSDILAWNILLHDCFMVKYSMSESSGTTLILITGFALCFSYAAIDPRCIFTAHRWAVIERRSWVQVVSAIATACLSSPSVRHHLSISAATFEQCDGWLADVLLNQPRVAIV